MTCPPRALGGILNFTTSTQPSVAGPERRADTVLPAAARQPTNHEPVSHLTRNCSQGVGNGCL
eukprot:7837974-Pyramimonas_sp.AAC.1